MNPVIEKCNDVLVKSHPSAIVTFSLGNMVGLLQGNAHAPRSSVGSKLIKSAGQEGISADFRLIIGALLG